MNKKKFSGSREEAIPGGSASIKILGAKGKEKI